MATLAEIRSRAQTRADQEGGNFPSAAQYNQYIDDAAKETFADLVMSGWPIDYSTDTINVTSVSQRVWPIASGTSIFAVTMVYSNVGGKVGELRRVNPGHMAALRSSGVTRNSSGFYEIRVSPTQGFVVEFYPKVIGTYFVDYIADYAGFGGVDAAVWLGPARSDELIVLKAASKGVKKEGRVPDGQALDAEYRDLLVKVKELAGWVDLRNPAQMRDAMPTMDTFSFDAGDNYFAGPGGMF